MEQHVAGVYIDIDQRRAAVKRISVALDGVDISIFYGRPM